MRWTKAALWPEPVSLDAPVSQAEDAPLLGEVLPDAGPSPEALASLSERERLAHRLVATLPVRERSVVTLRFGMAWPGRQWSLQLIATMCALSRERVRQIERSALQRLRGELPARLVPALARTWAPPPSDAADRLAALDDVLLRDDLDADERYRFSVERIRLRSRSAS